jgi:RNase adapter protein RapZ
MRIFLVTGLSGAGKSVALKMLEDIGCEAIDNVPLELIPSLTDSGGGSAHSLAIGTDARSRDFSPRHFRSMLDALKASRAHEVKVLFFDCDNEVLQRRFTETRRKHPLALDRPVMDGIVHERELLAPLRDMADVTFDTSEWTSGDLRHAVRQHYGAPDHTLSVAVTSFSFKRGIPREADLVFDVRFLSNPFYDEALRHLTGIDSPVRAFIEQDSGFDGFFSGLTQLLVPLLPRYLQEGKSYLTIAIGCTGGRHRSVAVAEKLAGFLKKKEYKVEIRHRDIGLM